MTSIKKPEKSLPRSRGAWIEELFVAVGRPVRLETRDGVRRAARLSGLRSQLIAYGGTKQDFVIELELNGDPSDTVPIGSLVKLDID